MSPLKDWLENHDVRPAQLAMVAGVDAREVYRAATGLSGRIPRRILEAIAAIDTPQSAADLETAWTAWRIKQASELRASLR
ncbi:MAG: hypothetical protein M1596_05385 [Firmicutes bacterium]|nr:hypothetical protein [Bacillota bacterium]